MSEFRLQSVLAQQRHVDCTLIIRPLFFVVKQIKGLFLIFYDFFRTLQYMRLYSKYYCFCSLCLFFSALVRILISLNTARGSVG